MLRLVALLSLVYDVAIGIALVFFRAQLQAWFGVAAPEPPIHVDLNAVFVTFVGVGYLLPFQDPVRYRPYMWIFGVALKLAGAALFFFDVLYRDSPQLFVLFGVSDLIVGLVTLGALAIDQPPTLFKRVGASGR